MIKKKALYSYHFIADPRMMTVAVLGWFTKNVVRFIPDAKVSPRIAIIPLQKSRDWGHA